MESHRKLALAAAADQNQQYCGSPAPQSLRKQSTLVGLRRTPLVHIFGGCPGRRRDSVS